MSNNILADDILNIHSVQSFATLEGEGIRFAVFLQGCPYRCVYCHNPDTWYGEGQGTNLSIDDIVTKMSHYKGFYKNGGGLTVTGGEPLLQASKIIELFRRVREDLGLTNTIDTSCAVMPDCIEDLLALTDLVIIDLKFHNNADYKMYAKGTLDKTIAMLDVTLKMGVNVWIRTVVVPDINDTNADMDKYVEIVNRYPHISKYELLAYHTMGEFKYAELNIKYPLAGVEQLSLSKLKSLQKYVDERINLK